MPEPVVVVGASAAGLGAVQGLRSRGYDGDLLVVDPDTALPYERPTLSKGLLRDLTGDPPPPPPDRLAALGAERVVDRAVGIDVAGSRVRLAGGRELGYRAVVLATGAVARRPPALDRPGVHVLRDHADAMALRAALAGASSLVVVGAGFLGTEVAAAAAATGRHVTVVDPVPAPVAPFGETVARRVAELHRSQGVELLLGRRVTDVTGVGAAHGVRLDDGRTVAADVVLLALGAEPADAWLAGSPVVRDGGVVVDAGLRAAPRVFAAGDVARVFSPRFAGLLRSEHWTTALGHGDLAATGVLGGGAPGEGAAQDLPYVWTEQYDVRICALGVTAGRRPVVVDRHPAQDRFVVAYTDPRGRLDGVLTWNWTRMLAPWRARVAAGERLVDES